MNNSNYKKNIGCLEIENDSLKTSNQYKNEFYNNTKMSPIFNNSLTSKIVWKSKKIFMTKKRILEIFDNSIFMLDSSYKTNISYSNQETLIIKSYKDIFQTISCDSP